MKAYPRWFLPTLVIGLIVLTISGLLLIPTALDMRFEQNVWWRLPLDQRLVTVTIHTSLSYLILSFVGALSTIHMRAGLRKQKNHHSGLILVSLFFLLAASGVGLFYFGDEALILLTSASHIVLGLTVFVLFFWHMVTGRRHRLKSIEQEKS